jgi:hypothetical protein
MSDERSPELQAKIDAMFARLTKPPGKRFTPVNHRQTMKTTGPSRLIDLDGSRGPGFEVRHYATTKAPKRRFKPGDRFAYDGDIWQIIYMYRLKSSPGIWYHCLEEIRDKPDLVGDILVELGAGATTPDIVFSEFPSQMEARSYFRDRCMMGNQMDKTTQELLKLKQL